MSKQFSNPGCTDCRLRGNTDPSILCNNQQLWTTDGDKTVTSKTWLTTNNILELSACQKYIIQYFDFSINGLIDCIYGKIDLLDICKQIIPNNSKDNPITLQYITNYHEIFIKRAQDAWHTDATANEVIYQIDHIIIEWLKSYLHAKGVPNLNPSIIWNYLQLGVWLPSIERIIKMNTQEHYSQNITQLHFPKAVYPKMTYHEVDKFYKNMKEMFYELTCVRDNKLYTQTYGTN